MSEANELIVKLEQGVDALLRKVEELNNENLILKSSVEKLSVLNSKFKEENLMLTENVVRLKQQVETTSTDSEKIGQYKSKIKELVNEIDSCISLLNR